MSVYAANRLNSIRENKAEEMLDEFTQAFLDESKETADVTPFGIIAQLHENDMRMFDAVITSDFSIVAESAILEADEAEKNQAKVDDATKKGIGTKIKEFFVGLKNAIIALYRKLRDKVLDLVSADKKIIKMYEPIIKKLPSDFSIKMKGVPAFMFKGDEIDKICPQIYSKLKLHTNKALSQLNNAKEGKAGEAGTTDLEIAIKNISNVTNDFADSIDNLIKGDENAKSGEVKIGKGTIENALSYLIDGKKALASVKKGGAEAVKAVNDIEKGVKSYKFVTAQQANACYKLISTAGKEISRVSKIHSHLVAKELSACRKIVLLAGRTAKNGGISESALDQYTVDALMESSDLYVAEKFAY